MNKNKVESRELAFEQVATIVDDVAAGYLRTLLEKVKTKENAQKLIGIAYDEYIEPVLKIRESLDILSLLEEYIRALGGLRTDVLGEEETEILFEHFDEEPPTKKNVC